MEQVADEKGEKLDELSDAFEKAFYEDEKVLTRLHAYVSRHKDQFPSGSEPRKQ